MLCFRWVLPFLAFYLLLEEMSAFILPKRLKQKRDVSWLDQEFFPHLPDRSEKGDLSLGDAGDTRDQRSETRDLDGWQTQSAVFQAPLEHLPVHRPNHRRHQDKNMEKWRKVSPLDSIGSSLMSSQRNKKDEPGDYWEV